MAFWNIFFHVKNLNNDSRKHLLDSFSLFPFFFPFLPPPPLPYRNCGPFFTFVMSLFTYFFSESPTIAEPQINMLAVQADLEEIVFKSKMLCVHARNPFTREQLKASSSEDVIQHISEEKRPFRVRAVNRRACSQRKLPHGYGSLKTLTDKLIYSGYWRKGESI